MQFAAMVYRVQVAAGLIRVNRAIWQDLFKAGITLDGEKREGTGFSLQITLKLLAPTRRGRESRRFEQEI